MATEHPAELRRMLWALVDVIQDRGYIDLGPMDLAFGLPSIMTVAEALVVAYNATPDDIEAALAEIE